jgi:hypothetical protein
MLQKREARLAEGRRQAKTPTPDPFTLGFKLAYYAQKVLLVLVARREASIQKVGRRFIYSVFEPSGTDAAGR